MANEAKTEQSTHRQLVEQIIELQREYAFENKGKDSERRRRLREIIEAATPSKGA